MHDIFGVEVDKQQAKLHLLPIPWEATTSYGDGTSRGPQAIYNASEQVDLFDRELGEFYKFGITMNALNSEIINLANESKIQAKEKLVEAVNESSNKLNSWVESECKKLLSRDKLVGLIGGDHSVPYGFIKALSENHKDFGILHFDAHADLRKAYQGFQHSHASIMNNVMALNYAPKKLVQIGIRDFCQEEFEQIQNDDRIETFFDLDIKRRLASGEGWMNLCREIISHLPDNVYISFDIDGLSPDLCPSTGTPVPGGLSFDQAILLLSELGHSGKKIIGFDLVEVAPGKDSEWDANVGMRILFKLCGWSLFTNGHRA